MDGITIPFLPTTIWIFAAALAIILVLLSLTHYLYYQRRMKALVEDGISAAELAAKKENLQADVKELRNWLDIQRDELNRVKAEREEQERLRALLDDLAQKGAIQDQKNEILRKEVGELENQRHFVTQTLEKLNQEVGNLEAKRGEAASLSEELKQLQKKIDDSQKTIESFANVEAKLVVFKAEQVTLENQVAEIRALGDITAKETELKRLDAQKVSHELEQSKMKFAEINREQAEAEAIVNKLMGNKNELESRLDYLRKEHDNFVEKVGKLRMALEKASEELKTKKNEVVETSHEADKSKAELSIIRKEKAELGALVNVLVTQKELLTNELRQTKDTIVKYNSAKKEVIELLDELKSLKNKRQREQEQVEEFVARKTLLKQSVEKLQGQMSGKETEEVHKAYEDLLKRNAVCFKKTEFAPTTGTKGEYLALEQFKKELRESNLYFPSRVIDAFHTSLKCQSINPLTVLAGVSGTGKTLLPVKYAEHMGLHSLVIPVQPRWDSPQDLFGFYNYLEKSYKATELSRALVRMDPYNYDPSEFPGLDYDWPRERMIMVLLDEMNLARTEYYFSEFLSKLELRRLVENPSNPAHREKAEIELDTGPGSNRSFRIWVPENVLFVGTMNEDETTQTLSDKVLDRSNLLRFGKPDDRRQHNDNGGQERMTRPFLTRDQWSSWCKPVDGSDEWQPKMREWIRCLNNALEKVGRPFGYRAQDAIALYLANYPDAGQDNRYKLAFADQVEQKIIPKLRGLDVAEPKTLGCLQEVASVIDSLGDAELSSAIASAIDESKNIGMFTWRGVTRSLENE